MSYFFPVRFTVNAGFSPPPEMVSVPVCVPLAVGVKVTVISYPAFACATVIVVVVVLNMVPVTATVRSPVISAVFTCRVLAAEVLTVP